MLSDSVLSFNTIHDRVNRCETGGLRHATWLGDEVATTAGLDIKSAGFANELWCAAQQSYSLDPVMGTQKFGPHYIVLKTPLEQPPDHDILRGRVRGEDLRVRGGSLSWRPSGARWK